MARFIISDTRMADWTKSEDTIYLNFSKWNDYSYRTLFNMVYMDENRNIHEIGQIKIGFVGQDENTPTLSKMQTQTVRLDEKFFSLAESPDFYSNLYALGRDFANTVLQSLNCVVVNEKAMAIAQDEPVFIKSLLRHVNINTIMNHFKRILSGHSPLTDFNFRFLRLGKRYSDLYLDFSVESESFPPTNIHAIIGRNGLGKTTLLNEMIDSIMKGDISKGGYFDDVFNEKRISNDYFSTVVSIAFSAFDPFNPLKEQNDPTKGTCFYYIGLKPSGETIKPSYHDFMEALYVKCSVSIYECFADDSKKDMWIEAITDLESDENFKELSITGLVNLPAKELVNACLTILRSMSSGHAIVFITITMLIEKLQEKTLVLFDEPESHLHPPLLSALVRIMSNLLIRRNGVAIIATHSPVVVQEVPKSCCWVLTRYGDFTDYSRPSIETFAENVGMLTKEVFKLEMESSGYHKLFKKFVSDGLSFEQIIKAFKGQIGFEGKAVLMSMVNLRDNKKNKKDI